MLEVLDMKLSTIVEVFRLAQVCDIVKGPNYENMKADPVHTTIGLDVSSELCLTQ